MLNRPGTVLLLLLAACFPGRAAVVRVWSAAGPPHTGASWPSAYATVADGLAAARPGDEVWVAAGNYPESVTVPAAVALYGGFTGTETARSQRNPRRNETVLQGDPARDFPAAVEFAQGATPSTVLDGFVIARAARGPARDGIRAWNASPTIRNNIIRCNAGAGILLLGSSAIVENNRVIGNGGRSDSQAGYNDSNGGISSQSGAPVLRGNVIAGNAGSGISIQSGRADVENNTIVSNGSAYGGGLAIGQNTTVRAVNNIIAFNASGLSAGRNLSITLQNNCIHANRLEFRNVPGPTGGGGNINADPRFVDLARADLRLRPESPCRDAGADIAPPDARDLDGSPRQIGPHVDIGAYESDGTLPQAAPPVIVRVRPDGSDAGDGSTWGAAKKTMQAAMDAAARSAGEVWAAAGVYRENVTLPPYTYVYGGFAGTETRRDQRDPSGHATVLDGGGSTVVAAYAGHQVSRLDGFTVRNGSREYRLGAISCGVAGPVFENDVIVGRVFSNGAATLAHCLVYGDVSGSLDRLENCRLTGSPWQAAWLNSYQIPVRIANNVVWNNGGGLKVDGGVELVNNTIVGNAGSAFETASGRNIVANNVIAFNGAGVDARDVYGRPSGAIVAAWMNCVFGNTSGDWIGLPDQGGQNRNIAKDPMLASARYGNFHLQPGSPCVNAGDSLLVLPGERDMDGQPRIMGIAVDIGADESDGTTWTAGPALLHVKPDGSDAADGRTWATARQSIPLAVADAPGGEIWVAAGTYTGSLTLNDVQLYGGFAGTETGRAQRKPRANETILDAQRAGSVVTFIPGAPDSTVVDGFTIQNGSANHGGGVEFLGTSRGTLSNNIIRNNAAVRGGGIMVEPDAAPTIARNIITGNGAAGGGGIEFWTDGRGTVKDNLIVGNSANYGAGIFASAAYRTTPGPYLLNNTSLDDVDLWISNVVVTNNILVNAGPGPGTWRYNLFTGDGNSPADADGNVYAPVAGFANPATGDYRLSPDSPAINAGDNAAVAEGDADLGGQPRIRDGRVDIGAYEFNPGIPTLGDAAAALRLCAGLTVATPELMDRLNVNRTGASKDVVDMADALMLLQTLAASSAE